MVRNDFRVCAWVQFAEIVVSVARKTDAAMWGGLFAAIGKPSGILEGLLEAGALRSAACCLVIVDRLEGAQASYALCLRLIRVSSPFSLASPPLCMCRAWHWSEANFLCVHCRWLCQRGSMS